MTEDVDYRAGFFGALVGDGRTLLKLTAISLIGSGLFAFFLASTGHFLPHDILYLGMSAEELHSVAHGRLAHFMMHDRVSFGGAIFAIGILYLWLAEFPLRAGKAWAWWTFMFSGIAGFASFLSYLGYGYLDSWHVAPTSSARALLRPGSSPAWRSRYGIGRALLLVTAWSLVLGGTIIMTVGMTTVFVPTDLEFMQITGADLASANPRLIPLIAHDRAGFGGGVCCCGLTMFLCVFCSPPCRRCGSWAGPGLGPRSGCTFRLGIRALVIWRRRFWGRSCLLSRW